MVASSEAIVAALSVGEESPERPDSAEPPLPLPEKFEEPVLVFDGVVVVVDEPDGPEEPDDDSSAVSALARALSSVATVA
jgi:hypothetical protein